MSNLSVKTVAEGTLENKQYQENKGTHHTGQGKS